MSNVDNGREGYKVGPIFRRALLDDPYTKKITLFVQYYIADNILVRYYKDAKM